MRVRAVMAVFAASLFSFGGTAAPAAPPVPEYTAVVMPETPELLEDWRKGDSFEAIYFPAVRASSSLAASGANRYSPKMSQDGDLKTAWVEGMKGDGVGSWLEFTFNRSADAAEPGRDNAVAIKELYLFNGYRKSEQLWRANGRVRTFDLLVNGKRAARLQLADTRRYQTVKTPRIVLPPGKVTTLRLVVVRVYRGRDHSDTAISELEWGGEGVF
ncbi:MAG: hypothetical protein H7145_15970 [Akkermansiaceae bacterium]|nr:hypothetical protein [Armatimonadota bacterium]